MRDLRDFTSAFPVPQPPVRESAPQRRSMVLAVSTEACRYGRCPPEHNHPDPFDPSNPAYMPEPDEFRRGWTTQNIPSSRSSRRVPCHCILCWEIADDLVLHICKVVEAIG